jgi:hypothetical protein
LGTDWRKREKRRWRAALQDLSAERKRTPNAKRLGVQHRFAVQPNNLFRLRANAAFFRSLRGFHAGFSLGVYPGRLSTPAQY